jgi:hypothetical protein
MRPHSIALIVASLASLLVTPAYALRANTYVASYGTDSGACSYSAPCRNFSYALSQVQAGGVVMAIDSAGYGAFSINKAVTIAAPAGVSPVIVAASGGTAIAITANSSDNIKLRGLTLDGGGTGNIGIFFTAGNNLSIEDCAVRNYTFSGLVLGNNGTIPLSLTVSNSYFTGNGANGILLQPNSSGIISASIDRTVLSGNGFAGLNLIGQTSSGGAVQAAVTDSVAANNVNGSNGTGFLVQSAQNQSVALLSLSHSSAVNNTYGISAVGTNAVLNVGLSTVSQNGAGYSIGTGAFIFSYGDNYFDGNTGNSGNLSTATKH